MLLILAQWLQDDFGFFRVFNYITFRAVMATVTALLIGWLRDLGLFVNSLR